MNNELLIALFSLAGTLLGTFGGILTANKLTTYRISQLEKKVDKHNSVIDRTYNLEKSVEVILEKITVANHRITDLEENHDRDSNVHQAGAACTHPGAVFCRHSNEKERERQG